MLSGKELRLMKSVFYSIFYSQFFIYGMKRGTKSCREKNIINLIFSQDFNLAFPLKSNFQVYIFLILT